MKLLDFIKSKVSEDVKHQVTEESLTYWYTQIPSVYSIWYSKWMISEEHEEPTDEEFEEHLLKYPQFGKPNLAPNKPLICINQRKEKVES